jgi:hypothetical protein
MAPVSDIARLNKVRLTHQQIADMMLSEDQLRRAAVYRHDWQSAEAHDEELQRLSELIQ